jgi:hypothetical protein
MVFIHKYFKVTSLLKITSLLYIAASSVFISAKLLYVPVTLEKTVIALFNIEKRRNPTTMAKVTLSKDREKHYRDTLEQIELEILEKIGFDFEFELPYKHIRSFCEKHVPMASRESLYQLAFKFCNDSFKLPVCLYFHPKIIAAACVQLGAKWRMNNGCDAGMPLKIQGHPWFKWIDSGIEQAEINEVIN